jgi:hypothetical protein
LVFGENGHQAEGQLAAFCRSQTAVRPPSTAITAPVIYDAFAETMKSLRSGLAHKEAIGIVWTLIEAGHYLQFVHQRGWTAEQFQAWLTDTLQAQLLPPKQRSKSP